MVQLMLILDTDLFLASLLLLVVRSPRQALQSALFLNSSVVYVPILPAPA